MTIACEGKLNDQIINEFGISVTVRQVTKSFPDEYGDASESYSDSTCKALMSILTNDDRDVIEGIYKAGDILFFFQVGDASKILSGALVQHDSVWYTIRRVMKHQLAGLTQAIEARVEKV